MFCPKCGKQLPDVAEFCSGCGLKIRDKRQDRSKSEASSDVKTFEPSTTAVDYASVPTASPEYPSAFVQAASASPATIQEKSVEFSLSLLAFWVKGSMSVDFRNVSVRTANTLFGIFPAGFVDRQFALGNISSAQIDTSYKGGTILLGIVLAFIGFGQLSTRGGQGMGLLLLVIGVVLILGAIKTVLYISASGGGFAVEVPFYEKGKLLEMQEAIKGALDVEEDNRNNAFLRHENQQLRSDLNEGVQALIDEMGKIGKTNG